MPKKQDRKSPTQPDASKHRDGNKAEPKNPTRRLNVALAPGVLKLLQEHLKTVKAANGKKSISRNDVINAALRAFLAKD